MGREEMVILDLGSEEDGTVDQSQAAITGHNIGWISPPSTSNDCTSQRTVAFTGIQQDWWTAAGPFASTPIAIVCLDIPLHVWLIKITMCQWPGVLQSLFGLTNCLWTTYWHSLNMSGEHSRGGHTQREKLMVLDESFVIWSLGHGPTRYSV